MLLYLQTGLCWPSWPRHVLRPSGNPAFTSAKRDTLAIIRSVRSCDLLHLGLFLCTALFFFLRTQMISAFSGEGCIDLKSLERRGSWRGFVANKMRPTVNEDVL